MTARPDTMATVSTRLPFPSKLEYRSACVSFRRLGPMRSETICMCVNPHEMAWKWHQCPGTEQHNPVTIAVNSACIISMHYMVRHVCAGGGLC